MQKRLLAYSDDLTVHPPFSCFCVFTLHSSSFIFAFSCLRSAANCHRQFLYLLVLAELPGFVQIRNIGRFLVGFVGKFWKQFIFSTWTFAIHFNKNNVIIFSLYNIAFLIAGCEIHLLCPGKCFMINHWELFGVFFCQYCSVLFSSVVFICRFKPQTTGQSCREC